MLYLWSHSLLPLNTDRYVVGGVAILNLTALSEQVHGPTNSSICTQYCLELTQVMSCFATVVAVVTLFSLLHPSGD